MKHIIHQELSEAATVLNRFISNEKNLDQIESAARICLEAIERGNTLFSCGNGGSHCDAMHFAEEMTGRYRKNRKALPAIAISDPSHLSCVGNDFGYDQVFSRYLEAIGKPGDVLLAISTSGNSANVVKAAETARKQNMKVIALSAKEGGQLKNASDVALLVNHHGFADRIQEIHIKIIHILILLIEKGLKIA